MDKRLFPEPGSVYRHGFGKSRHLTLPGRFATLSVDLHGGPHTMSNIFKTGLLLAVLTALLVLIGGAIGGQQGMLIAFVLALGMNFFSYWFSDKMVLAMYGAR